jgi:hypothetical protein
LRLCHLPPGSAQSFGDRTWLSNQNQMHIGLVIGESDRRRNRDRQTVIAAHTVDGNANRHSDSQEKNRLPAGSIIAATPSAGNATSGAAQSTGRRQPRQSTP